MINLSPVCIICTMRAMVCYELICYSATPTIPPTILCLDDFLTLGVFFMSNFIENRAQSHGFNGIDIYYAISVQTTSFSVMP